MPTTPPHPTDARSLRRSPLAVYDSTRIRQEGAYDSLPWHGILQQEEFTGQHVKENSLGENRERYVVSLMSFNCRSLQWFGICGLLMYVIFCPSFIVLLLFNRELIRVVLPIRNVNFRFVSLVSMFQILYNSRSSGFLSVFLSLLFFSLFLYCPYVFSPGCY